MWPRDWDRDGNEDGGGGGDGEDNGTYRPSKSTVGHKKPPLLGRLLEIAPDDSRSLIDADAREFEEGLQSPFFRYV